jgi:hypothetical protein
MIGERSCPLRSTMGRSSGELTTQQVIRILLQSMEPFRCGALPHTSVVLTERTVQIGSGIRRAFCGPRSSAS